MRTVSRPGTHGSSSLIRHPRAIPLLALLCAAVLAPAGASRARAGVTLQLTPAVQSVAPGAFVDVKLRVVESGSAFNAFRAVVVYDPAMLTPVQLSPLRSQIDTLISAACGTTFHKFGAGGGLDTISVSMLCGPVSVTGPGPIYRLRFLAGSTTGRTGLYFGPGLEFANGGITIGSVNVNGAMVGIGVPMPVLDAGPAGGGGRFALVPSPNPAAGPIRFEFLAPLAADGELTVRDLQGRTVHRNALGRDSRECAWSGNDRAGRALPPGVYLASLRCGTQVRHARVTLVR